MKHRVNSNLDLGLLSFTWQTPILSFRNKSPVETKGWDDIKRNNGGVLTWDAYLGTPLFLMKSSATVAELASPCALLT